MWFLAVERGSQSVLPSRSRWGFLGMRQGPVFTPPTLQLLGLADTLMGQHWGKGQKEGDWPSPLADVQHIQSYVPEESLNPKQAEWPLLLTVK